MADHISAKILTFDAGDEYVPAPLPPPEIPAWKDGSIRIGIHTSIAGNISGSLDIAHGLAANALQIFSCSPRMWSRGSSRISDADATRFRARRKELSLGPLAVHGNYLINLASQNPVLRAMSVQGFHQEIVRAVVLGADFLVAHPGSAGPGVNPQEAVVRIAQGLKQAARGLKLGDLQILLENTAGQGNSIGSRFEELRDIMNGAPDLPLGICIDTAHLFQAGWDIRTAEGLEKTLAHIAGVVGLDRIKIFHVNDSKTPLGSRVDRHEHIGRGKIGLEAFRRILNHPLLAGRGFLLETPIDVPGDDRRNVAALWALVGKPVAAGTGDGMKPRRRKAGAAKPRLAKKAAPARATKAPAAKAALKIRAGKKRSSRAKGN